jgi:hypothetical protein
VPIWTCCKDDVPVRFIRSDSVKVALYLSSPDVLIVRRKAHNIVAAILGSVAIILFLLPLSLVIGTMRSIESGCALLCVWNLILGFQASRDNRTWIALFSPDRILLRLWVSWWPKRSERECDVMEILADEVSVPRSRIQDVLLPHSVVWVFDWLQVEVSAECLREVEKIADARFPPPSSCDPHREWVVRWQDSTLSVSWKGCRPALPALREPDKPSDPGSQVSRRPMGVSGFTCVLDQTRGRTARADAKSLADWPRTNLCISTQASQKYVTA